MGRICTMKNRYQILISVKNWCQIITCEKCVTKNLIREKNWYNILTFVKNCYHIITVLNRHRCQWQNCEEFESSAKCSIFCGYFINMRNTHKCYIKLDSLRIFHQVKDIGTKYAHDVLVPIFHKL